MYRYMHTCIDDVDVHVVMGDVDIINVDIDDIDINIVVVYDTCIYIDDVDHVDIDDNDEIDIH